MYHCSQIYRNPHYFRASQGFEKSFIKRWLSVYCRSPEGKQLAIAKGIDNKLFSELLNDIDNLDADLTDASDGNYVKLSFDNDYLHDQTLERIITAINNVNINPKQYLERLHIKLVYSQQDAFIINDCGVGVLQDVFILPLTPNLIIMSKAAEDNSQGSFNYIANASNACIEEVNKIIYNSQKRFIFSNHEKILKQIVS